MKSPSRSEASICSPFTPHPVSWKSFSKTSPVGACEDDDKQVARIKKSNDSTRGGFRLGYRRWSSSTRRPPKNAAFWNICSTFHKKLYTSQKCPQKNSYEHYPLGLSQFLRRCSLANTQKTQKSQTNHFHAKRPFGLALWDFVRVAFPIFLETKSKRARKNDEDRFFFPA